MIMVSGVRCLGLDYSWAPIVTFLLERALCTVFSIEIELTRREAKKTIEVVVDWDGGGMSPNHIGWIAAVVQAPYFGRCL
jgi:hypothetical protein